MAGFLKFLLAIPIFLLISNSPSFSQNPILPKAAIFPVSKDPSTLQYITRVFMGGNLERFNLVVDLNGPFVWMASEFHPPIKSCSLKCSMANPTSKSCSLQAENRVSRMSKSANLSEEMMVMELWDGTGSSSFVNSENFLFLSAPDLLLAGLASEAKGVFGLGDSRISLPSQISTKFGFFERKFCVCLSSKEGVISLGGTPFSNPMIFTPLISKRSGYNHGYYINLGSIKIDNKKLNFHQKGILEARISTIVPYTTMQSKIYATFVDSYIKASISMNLSLVEPVAPFEVCFTSKHVEGERVLPKVPSVDLVLQSGLVKWRIGGRNSMVVVGDEVMCLGFLDGGVDAEDLIVVGGYQLEDHVLEFDLGNSMLGVSSLLVGEKKCSDFEGESLLSMEI